MEEYLRFIKEDILGSLKGMVAVIEESESKGENGSREATDNG